MKTDNSVKENMKNDNSGKGQTGQNNFENAYSEKG